MYRYFYGNMFSVLLGELIRVTWVGYIQMHVSFLKKFLVFQAGSKNIEEFQSLHIFTNAQHDQVLNLDLLTDVW